MDITAAEFRTSLSGCSFCDDYLRREKIGGKLDLGEDLSQLIDRIKNLNRNSQYDCIVGVSGGVDSSVVLIEAINCGLRPLAVHMDNGWNSELAQNNINNLIRHLNVDLYTHVIDWTEYRSLMQAMFDCNVRDIELLYDNAMLAVNYKLAKKFGIKTILSGMNFATEGMMMPSNWNWFKYDQRQIRFFAKKAGIKVNTFPSIGTLDFLRYTYLNKIKWEHFLDYFDFNKEKSLLMLENRFGYKRYPYKHFESVFTRFYQGYILPKKFEVDKRKLHLSTLIMSGQLSRKQALATLEQEIYDSIDLLRDKKYFCKKMGWTERELDNYMSQKEVAHDLFPSEKLLWDRLIKLKSILKL